MIPPFPRKRKDFKDIVQLTQEELIGVRFRFSYGGGMGCKPFVVSYSGIKPDGTDGLMTNFHWGQNDDGSLNRAIIVVPIDQQCLPHNGGDHIRVVREYWLPDSDQPDGNYYYSEEESVCIPKDGPVSYSQIVINCMRGEPGKDGQVSAEQLAEIKAQIVAELRQEITAQSLGITLESLGLKIDTSKKQMTYGGKTYDLTEHVDTPVTPPSTAYDFYIGNVQSNASGFSALTADTLATNATKYSISATKSTQFKATQSCVFLLIPTSHQHLSLTKMQYTSGGMTTNVLADQMWNLTHDDVTIGDTTYKVYGYRSGGITSTDPLTFDYTITYAK